MDLAAQSAGMIRTCVSWIEDVQNADGGLPSDREGSSSCTWTTSGLLWACWTAGVSFKKFNMEKALAWVLDNTNQDNGIPLVTKGDYSVTDATAQTVIAGCLAQSDLADPRIFAVIEGCSKWLLYHHQRKAGWNWRPSSEPSWTASTAFAVLGLSCAKNVYPTLRPAIAATIKEAVAWLRQTQNDDGGWGAYEGDHSRPAITGLVSSVLTELRIRHNIRSAMSFIVRAQQDDGHWPDAVDRPTGHTVTRIGVAYCLRALAFSDYPLSTTEFTRGFRALQSAFDQRRFRYRDTDMLSWPTRDYLIALTAIGSKLGIPDCRLLRSLFKASRMKKEKPSRSSPEPLRGTAVARPSVPRRETMLCRILHISDIHRGQDAPTSNATLSYKLLDDINRTYTRDNARLSPGEPLLAGPDVIVVSGDVAQRATDEDYRYALQFLESLLPLVNGDRTKVVLVPGNHDVNWALSAEAYVPSTEYEYDKQPPPGEPYRQFIKRATDGSYWRKCEPGYTQRFRFFKELFDTFYQGAHTYSFDRADMYTVYDFSEGFKLVIVGFNSCDEIDAYRNGDRLCSLDRRAFINTDAIYSAVHSAEYQRGHEGTVRVAVFHHNIRSIGHGEDFLDPKYLQILKLHGFAFCLHGHVHSASYDVFDGTQADVLSVVGAGSLAVPYTDRPPGTPMGYNLVVVDCQSGAAWMHTRRHDEDHLIWVPDHRWNGRCYFQIRGGW